MVIDYKEVFSQPPYRKQNNTTEDRESKNSSRLLLL